MLENNVSENDIFRLQDSPTAEIFSARLEEFSRKFPNTMLYLKAIPAEKWVLYAQVSPFSLPNIPEVMLLIFF
jgi:hypothetical protein